MDEPSAYFLEVAIVKLCQLEKPARSGTTAEVDSLIAKLEQLESGRRN